MVELRNFSIKENKFSVFNQTTQVTRDVNTRKNFSACRNNFNHPDN